MEIILVLFEMIFTVLKRSKKEIIKVFCVLICLIKNKFFSNKILLTESNC